MKIIKVKFGIDHSVAGLYINTKLYKYGDYYHNKIDDYIEGFLEGLIYANVNFDFEKITLPNENEWVVKCSELGHGPPENYGDLYK
jgi:hypothetical protein